MKKPAAAVRSASGSAVHPRLDLVLGGAGRVEVGRLRLRRHAGDERRLVVEPVPRPLVDEEGVEPRLAERRAVGEQLEEQRLVAGPDLAEVERVEDARRLDHLRERAALALRQRAHVRADVDRHEARGHGPQPRLVGRGRVRPGRSGSREGEEEEQGGETAHGGPPVESPDVTPLGSAQLAGFAAGASSFFLSALIWPSERWPAGSASAHASACSRASREAAASPFAAKMSDRLCRTWTRRGPAHLRQRAVRGGERLVGLLHRHVRDRQAGRRVVVVGQVLLRLLEHRDGPLGLLQLQVGGQPVRVEDRALLGRLRRRGLRLRGTPPTPRRPSAAPAASPASLRAWMSER